MAYSQRELSYGLVQVYNDKILGIGSYGKVCKARCGQLPCAAKLLHDTLFHYGDPGTCDLTRRFEQECQFLSTIKHPNVVQYLGTTREPQSQRPVLLMELMDWSLTRFLEKSTTPLAYHVQLNICHDVALALAYLHSNAIIHRDLSSNNVLLIGEGSRAKVTDFGMSRLIDANIHTTPLTQCPGTSAYMPPEALITPPQYSSKLDCFSHGVLTIQIVTKNFPNPGSANAYVEDPKYPGGRVLIQFPEMQRRKHDIDQVNLDHPLLTVALHCLKDRDTERPSAHELCGQITSLMSEPRYNHSIGLLSDHDSAVQRLLCEIEAKEQIIREIRAEIHRKNEQIQHEREDHRNNIKAKEEFVKEILETCHHRIKETEQKVVRPTEQRSPNPSANCKPDLYSSAPIHQQNTTSCATGYSHRYESRDIPQQHPEIPEQIKEKVSLKMPKGSPTLTWKQGESAPTTMRTLYGAAVVHDDTAYFSASEEDLVFSYTSHNNKWSRLQRTKYICFALAIVKNQLTMIGGTTDFHNGLAAISALVSLSDAWIGKKWKEVLPPMPTKRICAAAITTSTHLVVAGGAMSIYDEKLSVVEVMSMDTDEWFKASSLPQCARYPQITLCSSYLYLCDDSMVFSCSMDGLFLSCKHSSDDDSSYGSIWTRLARIPVECAPSLVTLRGHLLAVGGKTSTSSGDQSTGAINSYDFINNRWDVVSMMPTPRSHVLTAVLPNNEMVVVGGIYGKTNVTTEIASCTI